MKLKPRQVIDETVVAVKINAMEAHWGDVVPCNMDPETGCPSDAHWSWHCTCGECYLSCRLHRAELDQDNGEWELTCGHCERDLPSPLPWLPL